MNLDTQSQSGDRCLSRLPPQSLSLSKPDAGRMTAERRGGHGQTNTHMHTHMRLHTHASGVRARRGGESPHAHTQPQDEKLKCHRKCPGMRMRWGGGRGGLFSVAGFLKELRNGSDSLRARDGEVRRGLGLFKASFRTSGSIRQLEEGRIQTGLWLALEYEAPASGLIWHSQCVGARAARLGKIIPEEAFTGAHQGAAANGVSCLLLGLVMDDKHKRVHTDEVVYGCSRMSDAPLIHT